MARLDGETINVPTAMNVMKRAFRDDPDFAQGWYDNLACAAMDEGVDSKPANWIATRFMKNCFDADTRQR